MTSMIDRMARAMARHSTGGEMWEDLPLVVQDKNINLAYLALRTMREPSPELLAFFKLGGGWTADTEMGARIQAEMVKGFLSSSEYRRRFGP